MTSHSNRGRRIASEKYLEVRIDGQSGGATIADLASDWGTTPGELRQWARRLHPALYARMKELEFSRGRRGRVGRRYLAVRS